MEAPRPETPRVDPKEILSPLADPGKYSGSLVDFNLRAVRMGWLPSAPQLDRNPIQVVRDAEKAGMAPAEYAVAQMKQGTLDFAFSDPDAPQKSRRR